MERVELFAYFDHADGYTLDPGKSGLSQLKAIHLGLSNAMGLDISSSLKTACKAGYCTPMNSDCDELVLEAMRGYMKSEMTTLSIAENICRWYSLLCVL